MYLVPNDLIFDFIKLYHVQVVISTLPAQAGFTLPPHLLKIDTPPVIFDVVYKPARTKLIEQVNYVSNF